MLLSEAAFGPFEGCGAGCGRWRARQLHLAASRAREELQQCLHVAALVLLPCQQCSERGGFQAWFDPEGYIERV